MLLRSVSERALTATAVDIRPRVQVAAMRVTCALRLCALTAAANAVAEILYPVADKIFGGRS